VPASWLVVDGDDGIKRGLTAQRQAPVRCLVGEVPADAGPWSNLPGRTHRMCMGLLWASSRHRLRLAVIHVRVAGFGVGDSRETGSGAARPRQCWRCQWWVVLVLRPKRATVWAFLFSCQSHLGWDGG
jgi:hypothetical protein